MMKEHFRTVVGEALYEVVEQEVQQWCGASYRPDAQSAYRRAGSANSTVFLDGRREALKRPRVREQSDEGSVEVKLASWQTAKDPAQWQEATIRAVRSEHARCRAPRRGPGQGPEQKCGESIMAGQGR